MTRIEGILFSGAELQADLRPGGVLAWVGAGLRRDEAIFLPIATHDVLARQEARIVRLHDATGGTALHRTAQLRMRQKPSSSTT